MRQMNVSPLAVHVIYHLAKHATTSCPRLEDGKMCITGYIYVLKNFHEELTRKESKYDDICLSRLKVYLLVYLSPVYCDPPPFLPETTNSNFALDLSTFTPSPQTGNALDPASRSRTLQSASPFHSTKKTTQRKETRDCEEERKTEYIRGK